MSHLSRVKEFVPNSKNKPKIARDTFEVGYFQVATKQKSKLNLAPKAKAIHAVHPSRPKKNVVS